MRGVNIREVQRLLGHSSLDTTMVYTHVIRNLQSAPVSLLDLLTEACPASVMLDRNPH